MPHEWISEFPAAVTVCDAQGIILEMNESARSTFADEGGAELIGTNLMDCHNPTSQQKLKEMLTSHDTNVYTIEKNGHHKLIYQSPWFEQGVCMGLVEISMPIPADLPHFVRS